MSGQSVFHLHHANCKGTKFSCGFQIFWQKNTKRSMFFSKTHGVGAEVGDSYLLGRSSTNTYLLEKPLYIEVSAVHGRCCPKIVDRHKNLAPRIYMPSDSPSCAL